MNMRSAAVLAAAGLTLILAVGCSSSGTDSSDKPARSSTTTTRPEFEGQGSAAVCPALVEIIDASALLAADPQSSVAQRKARWDQVVEAAEGLAKTAPDEIRADVAAVATFYGVTRTAVAKYGYEANKVPQSEQAAMVNDSLSRSGARLDAYSEQFCTDTTTTTTTAAP